MRVTSVTAMFVLALGSAPLFAAESGGRIDGDLQGGSVASTVGSFAAASSAHSVRVSLARLGSPADVVPAAFSRDTRATGGSRYAGEGQLVAASYESSFEAPSRVPGRHGLYASVLAGLGMILFTVMRRLNN